MTFSNTLKTLSEFVPQNGYFSIAGTGIKGADVLFYDSSYNKILEREVKSVISDKENTLALEITDSAVKQILNGNGHTYVQLKHILNFSDVYGTVYSEIVKKNKKDPCYYKNIKVKILSTSSF